MINLLILIKKTVCSSQCILKKWVIIHNAHTIYSGAGWMVRQVRNYQKCEPIHNQGADYAHHKGFVSPKSPYLRWFSWTRQDLLFITSVITVQGTATSFVGVRVLASKTGQAERAASTGNATDRLHSDWFCIILSQNIHTVWSYKEQSLHQFLATCSPQ